MYNRKGEREGRMTGLTFFNEDKEGKKERKNEERKKFFDLRSKFLHQSAIDICLHFALSVSVLLL